MSKEPHETRCTIIRQGGDFVRSDGAKISPDRIQALLDSLDSPPLPKAQMPNLGISGDWLATQAESTVGAYIKPWPVKPARNQIDLLTNAFKDSHRIEKLLPSLYSGFHTDDYPNIELTIQGDGKKRVIASHSQYPFMIPWEIRSEGGTSETFNAEISRCLLPLLPRKTLNRGRISGEWLNHALIDTIFRSVKADWDRLEVMNKLPGVLERIQEKFEVISAEFDIDRSFDAGLNGGSSYLQCNLHPKNAPERFNISATLAYRKGQVEKLESFLSAVDGYCSLVQSIPWLTKHLAIPPPEPDPNQMFSALNTEKLQHLRRQMLDQALGDPALMKHLTLMRAGELVKLRLVGDRSLSPFALKTFCEDMKILGREDLARDVTHAQKEVALLNVGWSGWGCFILILPDKRTIFWRLKGTHLFGWDLAGFPTTARESGWACSAAIVPPEGEGPPQNESRVK